MSIPRIIHYCWFGNNQKPPLTIKCIESWKKYCKDYKIVEWNETNFDVQLCPLYVRQAYEAKKWAFVTDYVRLKVVYENGGIYLDTDVELKKSLDQLLKHKAYFGFENGIDVATGLGFGAEKNAQVLYEMMQDYNDIPFVYQGGTYDTTPCPKRNTKVLLKYGLKQDDSMQIIGDDILILPSIYLCPISYRTMKRRISFKTISIHWFSASWLEQERRTRRDYRREQAEKRVRYLKHFLRRRFGDRSYERLKRMIKKFKV